MSMQQYLDSLYLYASKEKVAVSYLDEELSEDHLRVMLVKNKRPIWRYSVFIHGTDRAAKQEIAKALAQEMESENDRHRHDNGDIPYIRFNPHRVTDGKYLGWYKVDAVIDQIDAEDCDWNNAKQEVLRLAALFS